LLQSFAFARRPPASTTDSNSFRHCFMSASVAQRISQKRTTAK
jgi:hypothetical protein